MQFLSKPPLFPDRSFFANTGLKGIIAGILFCCKRAEAELVYGLLYGIFGPSLTLFNTKTSFLVLLGILFPETLSRLSVKAGGTLHFR